MGSFKGNGRNQEPKRRRPRAQAQQPLGFLRVESLESRTLLAVTPWHPTSTNIADVTHGPMANEGQQLIDVYLAFQKNGNASSLPSQFPTLQFQGNSVDIEVDGTGDFNAFRTTLQNLGMQVTASSSMYAGVDGYVPISVLPAIAGLPQTLDAHASPKPYVRFQGVANNEADAATSADVARQQLGVTGTGVTVGVISDSVSQFAGGLADSQKTGDLPANVTVLQDGPAGSTDEGRAMLENVHDIAPGASLDFATGDAGGDLGFANNIVALANAGANVIGDDLGVPDEPFFQDGVIAQAIDFVTSQGHTYFSAAGNQANDGYLSNFRAVNATVGSLGAGTYMNFDPGGGTTTQLPITVGPGASAGNPADLVMQFDQPFATQEPAGSLAAPTSEVDFYILDSGGNVVASSTNNNVATRQPLQEVLISAPGTYTAVMKVVSGPAPNHAEFINFNENVDVTVSPQFGSAGGTFYPSSEGHETAAATIGVGAVPWWAPAPFLGQTPLNSEPFSSFGPAVYVFNPDGSAKASPQVVQAPVISAPDGGNTSFFSPGQIIDTSNPPFPGEPATATNLSQNLPTFFGTSSATPNAEAVAALMIQKTPGITPAQIRSALIASTTPLNGSTQGVWNPQGGFGEINAVKALNSVNTLSVSSTTPSFGQLVTSTPSFITVTFNQPVNFSTLNASDLVFTGAPPGVTPTVGAPIAVNDPTAPTIVEFPFSFTIAPNVPLANGTYSFLIQGPILSVSGQALTPFSSTFTLNDTTAPTITNVALSGRIITVTFDKAMNPASINQNTILVVRTGAAGQLNQPTNVQLNDDPRTVITYDPTTDSAIVNLNALDQASLPTDHYYLIVLAGDGGVPAATDLVGNPLNGVFSGIFPTTAPAPGQPRMFVDDLGIQSVTAPTITSAQLTPGSVTGISGQEITYLNQPQFVGQVSANFPGTVAGLTVLAEFNGLHGGNLDLATGAGGRGFVGSFDASATTDANGRFVIQAPLLPGGFSRVRFLVIGQPDSPPLPGFSSSFDHSFDIDNTAPTIIDATLTPGAPAPVANGASLSTLTSLSLNVLDPVSPPSGPLATPPQILFPALNPATADNIANYQLINTDTGIDESQFIASANFVATAQDFVSGAVRVNSSDPYAGRIDLTFSTGLPRGHYVFIAHTLETVNGVNFAGLRDAAGNALDDTGSNVGGVPGGLTSSIKDFYLTLDINPVPVYITDEVGVATYNGNNSTVVGGPRSFFEIPAANTTARATAPPTAWVIDFSSALAMTDSAGNPIDYSDAVQLIRSADSPSSPADGEFGTLGEAGLGSTGSGFTRMTDVTVSLADQSTGALIGEPGFTTPNRLVIQLNPGDTLPADDYRLYLPNSGTDSIFDIYGNQLDGEFLGNQTVAGSTVDTTPIGTFSPTPLGVYGFQNHVNPFWQDMMPNGDFPGPNGQPTPYQPGRMTGDGVGGGAFTSGFTVVPNGNIIYARPGYQQDPLNPATAPDGSVAKPYPVLAPQATATAANGGNLNATINFTSFDPNYDRAGIGQFAESALYAAQIAAANGPVVVVALPGTPQTNPITGLVNTPTFVLQAPAGSNPVINDGSASIPFDTNLVFASGSTLRLQNASLFIQNQGTALQVLGGPNPSQQVNFTSFATTPQGGDWGGIVFRNFDDSVTRLNPATFPVDGTLQGLGGNPAVSGAQAAMSIINFANINYAGGVVPATNGIAYDAITLYNSRPAITNDTIGIPNGQGSAQAGISGDLDSFREDDTARGPLIRQTVVTNYSLNGIWVRPNLINGITGQAEATDSIIYPDNPASLGGTQNYTFNAPLPYILTSALLGGQEQLEGTGGSTQFVNNRIYIQPGTMFKMQRGASLDIVNNDASINIGSRTYINQFDANPNIGPSDAGFKSEGTGDAQVLFTSLYDSTATTFFQDPITGQKVTLVPAIDSANAHGANQPVANEPANALARWGDVEVQSGAVAVVNDATFQWGGGQVNSLEATVPYQSVLAFITLDTPFSTPLNTGASNGGGGGNFFSGSLFDPLAQLGTRAIVTNNNFFNNFDAPMSIEPNGLLAADPLRPLESGEPFIHGNVMQANGIDGLAVRTSTLANTAITNAPPDRIETPLFNGESNLTVNSVWPAADFTYVLRGTIVLAGYYDQFQFNQGGGFRQSQAPLPSPTAFGAEQVPFITLTLQAGLAGTLQADGSTIPKPGEETIIKLMNDYAPWTAGTVAAFGSVGDNGVTGAAENGGAGFLVGVDDGIDPPSTTGSPLVDPGAGSQIRILGIAGNQSTGQQRVPVVITSLRDGSVGTTVRGVAMNNIWENDPNNPGLNLKTPAPGDGGYVYFGGNSLTSYDLTDPRAGNLIDNADVRFMTRIEIQGGGIIDVDGNPPTGPGQNFQGFLGTKLGQTPLTQFNTASAMTISDSVLEDFSDAAVFIHSGQTALDRVLTNALVGTGIVAAPVVRDTAGNRTQGTDVYMFNDIVTNSAVGVADYSDTDQTGAPGNGHAQSPELLTLLNNTFNNDTIALHAVAAGGSFNDHVYWLAMDNIFANSSNMAIFNQGPAEFSQAQYNVFWNNGPNNAGNTPGNDGFNVTVTGAGFFGNVGEIIGDPAFVAPSITGPGGNYQLGPNSVAIDASRSEIGPLPAGDAIYPTVNQSLTVVGGIRTDPTTLPPNEEPGRSNPNGGNAIITDPREIVTAPGTPGRGFFDEWVAVLPGAANAVPGPATNAGTFEYAPITGVRDQNGSLRVDDPNVSNVGFGSRPYFDIGAYEFVQFEFNPPKVTQFPNGQNVIATLPGGTGHDIYVVNGIGGINTAPQSIVFHFNQALNPSTVTSGSVELEAADANGNFSPTGPFINLAGRLNFFATVNVAGAPTIPGLTGPTTNVLVIDTSGLNLLSDAYRIVLEGQGSSVITNPQGQALDGLNLDAKGNQLALPSGADNVPGSDFVLTFTIDTNIPAIVPGSFRLAPASDTNYVGDSITNNNLPSFVGTITDVTPPIPPLAGDLANATVFLDVFDPTTGQFVTVGQGTTAANGNFTINTNAPLPDSPYNVGPDGGLNSPGNAGVIPLPSLDDSGYGLARIRIVDQAGNASNQFSDPLSQFVAEGATTGFVIDTQAPILTSISPASGTLAAANANGGVTISFTTNKNISENSLNNQSIQIINAGPDGLFGTPDDVPIPIDPGSFVITALKNGPQGPEQISFTISQGLVNGPYELIIHGAGPNVVTDIAGNPLAGAGAKGTDFVSTFVVFNPSLSHTLFVGPAPATPSTSALGTRENPFTTINAAMTVAVPGDIVAVLPGVYTESVVLKSLVRLLSADSSSTDTSLVPGQALQTVIRAPAAPAAAPGAPAAGGGFTVGASNVFSVPGLETEIAGFTIASPLVGDPSTGIIDTTASAVALSNSDVLVDKNYIIDSGFGVTVMTSGANAPTPLIQSDVIVGNTFGVFINDLGNTASVARPVDVTNDTFAFNTIGLNLQASAGDPILAVANNDIFWENHDQTPGRVGAGIVATVPNVLVVRNSLFSGNGQSETSPADDAFNVGNGFVASALNASPDLLGNFTGNPAFVSPSDPRPGAGADGPASFFLNANFDLTASSAAIDAANNATAPPVDFLYRTRVAIPGRGFPGTGPADVGAFEFEGKGGITSGGSFQVTSPPIVSPTIGQTPVIPVQNFPQALVFGFSNTLDPSSVHATDLILSGPGINPSNPAHALSLSWVDDHTIAFNLAGGFNATGAVNVSIPAGVLRNVKGQLLPAFSETIILNPTAVPSSTQTTPTTPAQPVGTPTTNPVVTITPVSPVSTPAPAASPHSVKHPKAPVHKAPAPKAVAKAEAKAAAKAAAAAKAEAKAAARAAAKKKKG